MHANCAKKEIAQTLHDIILRALCALCISVLNHCKGILTYEK